MQCENHRLIHWALVVCTATILSAGCASIKSAADPAYGQTKYEDINKAAEPFKWKVSVQFQRDAKPFEKADSTLQDSVERVLRATGVIVPTPDSASDQKENS
jgi:hypothetical protein